MNNQETLQWLKRKSSIIHSPMFPVLKDMRISSSQIQNYSNSFHRLVKQKGTEIATKKILDLFRVNPFVAVKIMESCQLYEEAPSILYGLKLLFSAMRDKAMIENMHLEQSIVLNDPVPYMALLIEAAYQDSVSDIYDNKDLYLDYACTQDLILHKRHIKSKYLNSFNIRHILNNIPEGRKIELINWFWKKHCLANQRYGKVETYASKRVAIIMSELVESSLWKHLESQVIETLSDVERKRVEREKNEIKQFVALTLHEKNHINYLNIVLGGDNMDAKIRLLINEDNSIQRK